MRYPQTVPPATWTRVAQLPLYMVRQDSDADQTVWTDSKKNLILPLLGRGYWTVKKYHFEDWMPCE